MNKHQLSSNETLTDAWLKKTLIYRDWQERKAEILKHKWLESQKAGHDIGWNRAMVDWLTHCSGEYYRNHPPPHDR